MSLPQRRAPSWTDELVRYQTIARRIEPAAKLVTKDSWFWRALAYVVHGVTFGGTTRKEFLEDYSTTIGPLIAIPGSNASVREGLLVHEANHAADMRKASFGLHPWAGLPLYGIAYLLVFLPLGLAWARYRLELRADTAEWRYELARGQISVEALRERAAYRGESLRGGAYGYAWPWAVRGYKQRVEAVIKERSHAT